MTASKDRWYSTDLPVLRAAADVYLSDWEVPPSNVDIELATGLEPTTVWKSLELLAETGYIRFEVRSAGPRRGHIRGILEPGLEAAELWPTAEQVGSRIMEFIAAQAENGPEEDRSRWAKLAVFFAEGGRDLATMIGAALLTR